MRFHPRAGLTNPGGDDDGKPGRRGRGRLGQEAVVSSIGKVIDLSPDGMRACCRRPPKDEFAIQIIGLGEEFEVRGRVVWSKRRGLFQYEVGIEFIDVSDDMASRINRLGMTNRHRRAV